MRKEGKVGNANTVGKILAGGNKKAAPVIPKVGEAGEYINEDYGIMQALFEELLDLAGMNKWATRDAVKIVTDFLEHKSPSKLFSDLNTFGRKHGSKLKEPILDLVGFGLDVIGIFEPTPIADILSGSLSAARGRWLDAGLTWVGVIPYAGDLGKIGKFKRNKTIRKILKKTGDGNIYKLAKNLYSKAQAKVAKVKKATDAYKAKVAAAAKKKLDDAAAAAKKKADELKEKLGKKADEVDNTSPKKPEKPGGSVKKRSPSQKKGDCAEHLAKQYLKEQGIESMKDKTTNEVMDTINDELSSVLTNGSGHGIDYFGMTETGQLVVAEIKGNTSGASKLQQQGGPQYLKDQLKKMQAGIEEGKGNFKAFKNDPAKLKAFETIKLKAGDDNTDFKFIKVELEDDPTGEYDIEKGGCKNKKGTAPKDKPWTGPITPSGNPR